MVAVIGRSGSGKSTLLHLLGGLDTADEGRIVVGGQPLTGASERELTRIRLRSVGFVFQSFELIEELTGEENVLLPTKLPGAPPGGAMRARRLIGERGGACVRPPSPHALPGRPPERTPTGTRLGNRAGR